MSARQMIALLTLIAGDPPIVDPYPVRYSRLVDGTDLGAPGMM